jgi:hypothetical protein
MPRGVEQAEQGKSDGEQESALGHRPPAVQQDERVRPE